MKRIVLITTTLLILPILFYQSTIAHPSETTAFPTEWTPEWGPAAPGSAITSNINTPNGTNFPEVSQSPDGSLLIAVFNTQVSSSDSDDDPYFSFATRDAFWSDWSSPKAIYNSPGLTSQSAQVTVAFTEDGSAQTAHAAWVERGFPTEKLAIVSDHTKWPASTYNEIASTILTGSMKDPSLIAKGNELFITWSQDFNKIMFSQSANATDWTNSTVYDSPRDNNVPDIAVDADGVAHIVWQEDISGSRSEIWYAQGNTASPSISWSTPISISGNITHTVQPSIVATDNGVDVAFTYFADLTEKREQQVYLTTCYQNCSAQSKWSTPRSVHQFVGVNGDAPFFLVPDLTYDIENRVSYLYFHGTDLTRPTINTEFLWGWDSCSDWQTLDDNFLASSERTVNPSIVTGAGNIHMVFEVVTEPTPGETLNQIYHMYGAIPGICPYKVQLPIILKD